jgi:hypothetical protein
VSAFVPTPIHPQPCMNPSGCGGPIALLTGECGWCGAKHWLPQPGPQTQFLECDADVALIGGAAYAGKTVSLLLDVIRYIDTPGWVGLILRRKAKDHADASSIYEKAKRVFAGTGAHFRGGSCMDCIWPSGATLMFRHVDDQSIEGYQGGEYPWIGVDEVTHFDMPWLIYLIGRQRSHTGVKPRMRMTCNPDPDHAIAQWVDPFFLVNGGPFDGIADRSKSGVLRYWATTADKGEMVWADSREECATLASRPLSFVKTFTFIGGTLQDNVIGMYESPEYEGNLATRGAVLEARERFGNWRTRTKTHGMLRGFDDAMVTQPLSPILHRVRAWDKASTRPTAEKGWNKADYTIGIRIEWDYFGRWYITDMVACREDPGGVNDLIARTVAADGDDVKQVFEIDPAAAGKFDAHNTRTMLRDAGNEGIIQAEQVLKNKILKATPMADQLRLGMDGNRPRTTALKEGDHAVFQPRGFIIKGDWWDRPYHDAAPDHPKTLGALFDRQWAAAFSKEHDDVPDAASIAINSRKPPPRQPADPLERAKRLS